MAVSLTSLRYDTWRRFLAFSRLRSSLSGMRSGPTTLCRKPCCALSPNSDSFPAGSHLPALLFTILRNLSLSIIAQAAAGG